MSFRDQLIKRLDDIPVQEVEILADEVIRLMEWARQPERMYAGLIGCYCGKMHVAGHDIFYTSGHKMLEPGEKMPLTLPPEDWKP